jgi:UDP-N-acetylmuramate--alanine ligase
VNLAFDRSKVIHFIGIGGIGMSGIAEILNNLGYPIQGSDISLNANTQRLEKMGIRIFIGHEGANVHNCDVVVISSAVKKNNQEYQAAITLGIPVIKRAEMLAEIMKFKRSIAVAGTHGKTTTTSMNATLLDAAGLDPTIINGGIINSYKTNAKLGSGDWIVVEADESDGTFVKLPATIGIITNIDAEHMEHYGDMETLKSAFHRFIDNVPFYGCGILCIDHPVVHELSKSFPDKHIITYGFHKDADIKASNVRTTPKGCFFDVEIINKRKQTVVAAHENITFIPKRYKDLFLPMVGEHNVQNFLTCIAVAEELQISEQEIRSALAQFKGVKRRFSEVGIANGITIIDDYAHHPVEIKTVIKAAQQCQAKRIITVIQPHRYSRLKEYMEEYVDAVQKADIIILSPVYSAGEDPIENISSSILAEKMRKSGKIVYEFEDAKELPYLVSRIAVASDMVLCLGAGSITLWSSMLPLQLEKMDPKPYFPHTNVQV